MSCHTYNHITIADRPHRRTIRHFPLFFYAHRTLTRIRPRRFSALYDERNSLNAAMQTRSFLFASTGYDIFGTTGQ